LYGERGEEKGKGEEMSEEGRRKGSGWREGGTDKVANAPLGRPTRAVATSNARG